MKKAYFNINSIFTYPSSPSMFSETLIGVKNDLQYTTNRTFTLIFVVVNYLMLLCAILNNLITSHMKTTFVQSKLQLIQCLCSCIYPNTINAKTTNLNCAYKLKPTMLAPFMISVPNRNKSLHLQKPRKNV